ncbi:antibiotic biosynthesis monooxygenase [Mucilaginibacter achroorhodeus]|uniref:Antibiotic biosynthesis monooxygenase n=1 Tax=Mucilaginibacter achroorhodeus TaxID=2599294 RepID=A0A563TYY2_9SPHI|nr:putative quinol monooxygenase [Mucilaginibacter achroorhodeus]TWR24578.1 antibiotic biosynthesis monooxygenase [Mucilaginibacter achroorhodeus]
MSISVVASLACRRDAAIVLGAELRKLVLASLKEDGCINCQIYQSQEEPSHFYLQEEWTDAAKLKAHRQSQHYKYFNHISPALLYQPAVVKVQKRLN